MKMKVMPNPNEMKKMMMKKQRVSMVFDSELLKHLRNIQGDKILKSKRSVTFSETVVDLIKIGNKKWRILIPLSDTTITHKKKHKRFSDSKEWRDKRKEKFLKYMKELGN